MREVKIHVHCVKLFLCILIWKDKFIYKVCELVEVGLQNFYTFPEQSSGHVCRIERFPSGS